MKKVVEQVPNHLEMIEVTLGDGSKVYNVRVIEYEYAYPSEQEAEDAFLAIRNALEKSLDLPGVPKRRG